MYSRAVKEGFFHLLSANFLVNGLAFVSMILITKILSPVQMGEIKIVQSYGALFLLVAGFGFNASVLKFCNTRINQEDNQNYLSLSLRNTLLASAGAITLLTILSQFTGLIGSSNVRVWLLAYSPYLAFAAMANLFITYIQTQKRFKQLAGLQSTLRTLGFFTLLAGVALWDVAGFIAANIFVQLLMLLLFWRKSEVQVKPRRPKNFKVDPLFYHVALTSFAANAMGALGQNIDVFMADSLIANRESIGYYSIATIFVLGGTMLVGTIQQVVTPFFNENAGSPDWLKKNLFRVQISTIGISLGISALVYTLAWAIVRFFYKDLSYLAVMEYLPWLLGRFLLISSASVFSLVLFSLGRVGLNFVVGAGGVVIGLVSSYILINEYGLIGAAWAQVISGLFIFTLQLGLSYFVLFSKRR